MTVSDGKIILQQEFIGISLQSGTKIIGEGRVAEASSSKIVSPGKNRHTRKDKIVMDDFDIGVLRRKIHKFYTMKKEIPTVSKLYSVLKEEIGFKGSREILRQHIKKIGFRFRKTKSNRKVLIERNYISAWRAKYLQVLKNNDETHKLPVVYLDETYIHTGLSAGKCWQKDDDEGFEVRDTDVDSIHRVRRYPVAAGGGGGGRAADPRPPAVVVRFCQRRRKDELLAAARARRTLTSVDAGLDGATTPIYLNHHLTPYYKSLLMEARKLKTERNFKHVWVNQQCKIYMRKEDNSKVYLISNSESFKKLK